MLHWEWRAFSVKSETKWKCSLYLSSNLLGDNRRAFNCPSGCLSCFQSPVVEAFSICWESWELKSFVPVSSNFSYWSCNGCESAQQISLWSRCVKVTLSSALMELPVMETCVDFMARWRSPETERRGQRGHGWRWRWREKDVNRGLIFLFQHRPNGTVWRIVEVRQIFHSEGGETLRPSRVGLLLWTLERLPLWNPRNKSVKECIKSLDLSFECENSTRCRSVKFLWNGRSGQNKSCTIYTFTYRHIHTKIK